MDKWEIYKNDAWRYVIFIENIFWEDGKIMYSFMDDWLNEYYTSYIDWYKLVKWDEIKEAKKIFEAGLEWFREVLDKEFEAKKQILSLIK